MRELETILIIIRQFVNFVAFKMEIVGVHVVI